MDTLHFRESGWKKVQRAVLRERGEKGEGEVANKSLKKTFFQVAFARFFVVTLTSHVNSFIIFTYILKEILEVKLLSGQVRAHHVPTAHMHRVPIQPTTHS